MTSPLYQHLQEKYDNRDTPWEEKFFKLLSEATVEVHHSKAFTGPDGWPYISVNICQNEVSESGHNHGATAPTYESIQRLLFWLSTRGIGLVINPINGKFPEFVFSYGMIWSYRETGYFRKLRPEPQKAPAQKEFIISPASLLVDLQLAPKVLPPYARQIIASFLKDQKINSAEILPLQESGGEIEIGFSLQSLGSPPAKEHEGILEALSWFFPPHYALGLIDSNEVQGFVSLEPKENLTANNAASAGVNKS